MKLHVLGCAGGIGGQQRLTTCLLVDDDILLDAGTGLSSLDIEQLAAIDHVFLSHSHLDHVAGLALLADAVAGRRARPITVHATPQVIAALKTHLFNWVLWPDFTTIPTKDNPVLRWLPFEPGACIALGERRITSYPVNHTAGAVAYWVQSARAGFLFTGDMGSTKKLWQAVAGKPGLEKVIVDCSFPNAEAELAEKSKHYCPQSLLQEIGELPGSVEFLIYHLKPGQEDRVMQELRESGGNRTFRSLKCGDLFAF